MAKIKKTPDHHIDYAPADTEFKMCYVLVPAKTIPPKIRCYVESLAKEQNYQGETGLYVCGSLIICTFQNGGVQYRREAKLLVVRSYRQQQCIPQERESEHEMPSADSCLNLERAANSEAEHSPQSSPIESVGWLAGSTCQSKSTPLSLELKTEFSITQFESVNSNSSSIIISHPEDDISRFSVSKQGQISSICSRLSALYPTISWYSIQECSPISIISVPLNTIVLPIIRWISRYK